LTETETGRVRERGRDRGRDWKAASEIVMDGGKGRKIDDLTSEPNRRTRDKDVSREIQRREMQTRTKNA
jgi:hypothetical protein